LKGLTWGLRFKYNFADDIVSTLTYIVFTYKYVKKLPANQGIFCQPTNFCSSSEYANEVSDNGLEASVIEGAFPMAFECR
jgi:hypothetical protein